MSGGQHHRRLAWITAGGLALALVFGISGVALPPGETLWHLIAAPEEDGGWKFETIDGVDVRKDGYSLGIRWGRIVGFHDGCNGCGFDDELPSGAPDRMLVCTLQACPERPNDILFGRFAYGSPEMEVNGERLILTLPGHRAELVRASRD
ncbi:hypothetical protein [Qipengyuania aquimaris]|uniref:Uncharacterized protein n=1 Tax=Qipengyuania aquimaris TaxID=255984 RepID=A0A9Q3XCI2_9SPHN|nr:hypothetical protein [Qipengyuania aquimaris]MBY6216865.1 hypothetical protein [Qipengyuania aquimaris]UOR16553.1 hypothetical protein LCM05_05770 [Qipengyuania aquimaris]